MPVSPSRAAAFDILLQVERADGYASELLHSDKYKKLSAADHGLATEIVMGVLRWRSALDTELARFSSQKLEKLDREVLTSLRMAAFQLMLLDRVPAHAAVHESVELVKRARKRSAVPFVNALLRKVSDHTDRLEDVRKAVAESGVTSSEAVEPGLAVTVRAKVDSEQDLQWFASRYAHPRWMVARWLETYGWEKLRKLLHFNQQVPVTAVRLPSPPDEAALKKSGVVLLNGSLLKHAVRVDSGDLTHTEPFRAGRIAIQDEASQLVALLVGKGASILDCCAAPGGKTRLISDRNPDAVIVATDLHPHRARLLRQLVHAKNVEVIAADALQLPVSQLFDRVLVDAPCSGSGTISRNPEIKWRLKPDDLLELQAKQLAILESAMKYVRPGGRLIYSTCSLEREENQDVIEKAIANNSSFRLLQCRTELEGLQRGGELQWEDLDSLLDGPFLKTVPGVHPCDGFFAAILEKQ
jgi:16S rRNA (cytosine967-C5)-methyltransferase